jgi:hypothetical protein
MKAANEELRIEEGPDSIMVPITAGKDSTDPFPEGCEPLRLISIVLLLPPFAALNDLGRGRFGQWP